MKVNRLQFLQKYLEKEGIHTKTINIPGVFNRIEYLEAKDEIIIPHWLKVYPKFPSNKPYKLFELNKMKPIKNFLYPYEFIKEQPKDEVHIFGNCYLLKENSIVNAFVNKHKITGNIKHFQDKKLNYVKQFETFEKFRERPKKILYIIEPEDLIVRHDVEMMLIQMLAIEDIDLFIKFSNFEDYKLFDIISKFCNLDFDGLFYKVKDIRW